MNRTKETRLRKLEAVKGTTQRGNLIVACDRAEADRKLAEARANGFEGEPMVMLTGVPRAELGRLLNEVATRGRKINEPPMRTAP
jgi:malonyl CoA-acyl carrier protein transacylase